MTNFIFKWNYSVWKVGYKGASKLMERDLVSNMTFRYLVKCVEHVYEMFKESVRRETYVSWTTCNEYDLHVIYRSNKDEWLIGVLPFGCAGFNFSFTSKGVSVSAEEFVIREGLVDRVVEGLRCVKKIL